MTSAPSETAILLQRLHAGDDRALADILARDLGWLREQVERRLGPALRQRGERDDYLHDVVVRVLRHGPRFVVADTEHFRRLLLRIVEHQLRDEVDHQHAARRDARLAVPLPSESALQLDHGAHSATRPSAAATRAEAAAWVNLALALIDPAERQLILWRQHEDLSFAEIATRLAIEETAARKRFQRALQRLGDRLVELRSGRLGEALAASEQPG